MTTAIEAYVVVDRIYMETEETIEENFDGGDAEGSQRKYHFGRGSQTDVTVTNFSNGMAMYVDPKRTEVLLDGVPQLTKRKYTSVDGEGHTLYARAKKPTFGSSRPTYVQAKWHPPESFHSSRR